MKSGLSDAFTRVVLVVALLWASTSAAAPSDDEIRAILRQRVDIQHQSVGIVVGVVEPNGRRVVAYGSAKRGDSRAVNGDTVFEIGSITKIFTALLLSELVHAGEVELADPVNKHLPAGVRIYERGDRPITLIDLATHTSGLPRMPTNFLPFNADNPYADYTVEQLYRFVSTYTPMEGMGPPYEYSNLGFGLLGHVLSLRSGIDYESLIRARLCKPLELTSTVVTLDSTLRSRLAMGHDEWLNPVAHWEQTSAMAGAGALYSTADDLLQLVAAFLGYSRSPLDASMQAMFDTRRPTPFPNSQIGLGWQLYNKNGREIAWKNGATGGHRAYVGIDRKARVGIVVLSNAATGAGVDDIGRHLLDPSAPLFRLPPAREHVSLGPAVLDRHVGDYEARQGLVLTIIRDGDHLSIQFPGQTRRKLLSQSAKEFLYDIGDARATFETDAEGRSTHLVVRDKENRMPARRIDAARAAQARAAFARRIREQIPAPGSEAAVRRQIDGLLRGAPNYDDMVPALAEIARQQWPQIKERFANVGPLRSITFKSVSPTGVDTYKVEFENLSFEWRIGLNPEGKVAEMWRRSLGADRAAIE